MTIPTTENANTAAARVAWPERASMAAVPSKTILTAPRGTFDRNAYQREYMRGYRRRQAEKREAGK